MFRPAVRGSLLEREFAVTIISSPQGLHGETPMVKPVKFAHVVYQTRRFDEMIAWYEAVFEARVVHQDPALAFMTYDDEHQRLGFAMRRGSFAEDASSAWSRSKARAKAILSWHRTAHRP